MNDLLASGTSPRDARRREGIGGRRIVARGRRLQLRSIALGSPRGRVATAPRSPSRRRGAHRELQHRLERSRVPRRSSAPTSGETAQQALTEAATRLASIANDPPRSCTIRPAHSSRFGSLYARTRHDVLEAPARRTSCRMVSAADAGIAGGQASSPVALIATEHDPQCARARLASPPSSGTIRIDLHALGGDQRVDCRDDGHGLPRRFHVDAASSLGLGSAARPARSTRSCDRNRPAIRCRLVFPSAHGQRSRPRKRPRRASRRYSSR